MSTSLLRAALCCFSCSPTVAMAQNSSLLHTKPAGSRPPVAAQLPAGASSGLAPQLQRAATDVPLAPMQMIGDQTEPMPGQGAVSQSDYQGRPNIQLDDASWTYQAPLPLRTFRLNDVVTIRVDEITRVLAEGAAENRKRTLYEAILTDWIRINDFRLRPDPQENGDPSVATESNSNFRAESTVESRESMTFNIAASVVDIRPNGNLLLEAKKTIRVNDNLWETSLSGLCRAQDIGPDNVVLSKDVIDLEINKADRGHLRDGYKRGWFQRWFDRLQPF